MLYTGFEEIENYIDESVWRKYDMWWAHGQHAAAIPAGITSVCGSLAAKRIIYLLSPRARFDQNYAYKDYPTIIKSGGWNNWGTPEPLPDYPDDDFPPYQNGTVKDVQEWLNSAYNAI